MTIIILELMTRRLSTMAGRPGLGTDPPPPPPAAGPLLTSLIYPLEVVEGFDGDTGPMTGHMWTPVDDLDVAGGIDSGAITVLIEYEAITAETEALDVVGDIDSGSVTVLIEYESITAETEALDVAGGIDSGTVTVVINYINHDTFAELDVSAGLVSGSLT